MASIAELKKTVKGLVMPIPAVFDGKGEPDLPMMEKFNVEREEAYESNNGYQEVKDEFKPLLG